MPSDPDQRAEQIQANVSAALSRLRGEPADPALATRSMPGLDAGMAEGSAQDMGDAPDTPYGTRAPMLSADASLATDREFSASRFGGSMSGDNTDGPLSRLVRGIGAAEDRQTDLLSEVGGTPPPLPNLGDADAQMDRDIRRKRNRRIAAGGAVVLALVALWFMIPADNGSTGVPLITAETTPEKVKPENEGGLQIPNQDVAILNEPDAGNQAAETLLPPPEQPVTPPSPALVEPAAEPVDEVPAVSAPAPDEIPSVAANETPASPSAAGTETAAAITDAAPAASTTQTTTLSAAAGSARVQLAAVKSEEAARAEWARLQKALPDLLGGLSLHIEQVDKGADGIFFRVQAEPLPDKAAAKKLCADIKLKNQACIVAK